MRTKIEVKAIRANIVCFPDNGGSF